MWTMTLPFVLPAWVPWWVPVVVLIPVLLYALALFIMPFSVIGVKGRLDALEARLDDIHEELRRLAGRMPEPAARRVFEDTGYTPPVLPATGTPVRPPPVAERGPGEPDARRREAGRLAVRPMRTEPRLDPPV
jgi:hypothetical protein